MAWRSHGTTNVDLIAKMQSNRLIKSDSVAAAFRKVDRANYVLDKAEAYRDSPQSIKYGATISAPHMHAHATENLLPFLNPGAKVLDVGSGSGYTCAIFYHLVVGGEGSADGEASGGKVVGIDHIPQLVDWSVENLRKDGLSDALDSGDIKMVAGDGRQGWASEGPYNAIHVGAAAPTMPQPLIDQLASPGRMFIPVGEHAQDIIQVDKDSEGRVSEKTLFGVIYVPLTDQKKQLDNDI
ncbi:protein-L-isoaspartate O-methyltransferase [Rickenella mellea]|uniref:Protein-L-isoaspartate O-methyltransferase n=1 Tax=Rickenella mellea TaxID=50990 RepID=A0A4Y7Q5Y0_9AGAM|nr:protein-L-isoaspartate O-methyltransferase [Rickenella mellea]